MTRASAGPRYTPAELAALLHLPHRPTPEQEEIIAAPVAPLLVVAGAGAGKTETMAARVVWLVANGHVLPEQILGLTFTRKAAGELALRVRKRLAQLVRELGRDELLAGEPTIATYHSYAGRIVTEHGLRAGYEPTTRLLTEASCWQLADAVVRQYEGDMSEVDFAPTTVTAAVLQLAADLSEHLVDGGELAVWTGRFHAELAGYPGRMLEPVAKVLARSRARLALLPLVRAYASAKRGLEAMDFGDQLARAAVVARDHAEAAAIERERYRVVLLDEYQDTSHAQVVLLRSLYGGGHPVTAVGDPCQSIYGWRGASAGTLDRFPDDFRSRDGRPALALTLSTSWRNRAEILQVANTLSAPLRAAGHQVTRLEAARHTAAAAGRHTVRAALTRTVLDEAAWIAARVEAAWWYDARRTGGPPAPVPSTVDGDGVPVPAAEPPPTTAVLVRTRAQIPLIEAALRARGLPVDVVGLGGLLDTPEVRDVVSTLRILADPTDGAALLRLLTGPRWRIGPRDLVALYARARELAAGRRRGRGPVPDRLDDAALAEALDSPGERVEPGAQPRYSAAGYQRFGVLAEELARLRTRLDQPLPDLVADIERTIGLDVEVAVRPGDAGLARAHLDAFGEVAARFHTEAQGATLGAFLSYLEAAENEERGLAPGDIEVVQGAVQILTAHAAKGLEWDVVAVAGLCAGVFPGRASSADHYLSGLGVLPFPLRGDRAGLPQLVLSDVDDQRSARDAVERFTQDWRAHDEREERRLGYVSVTRPRRLLLCSGHWWGAEGTTRPRGPSAFLTEVRAACAAGAGVVDEWAPDPPPGATNPVNDVVTQEQWPADPLGLRRAALREAAALVAAAGTGPDGTGDPPDPVAQRWADDVELLLAERALFAPDPDAPVDVALPGRLTVSQLVLLRRDAPELARSLRRPLPARPDPHARRGTAFHTWLERHLSAQELLDIDELPGAADDDAAPDSVLAELQQRFLASPWAARTPVAVEVGFATTVAGVVVRGRMDAVYADADGGYEVVDWKTGRRPPPGPAARAAAVQLAVYRLAWAELAGCPIGQVQAAFHYVAEGVTVRPADLLDAGGLVALVAGVPAAGPADG